MPIVCGVSRRAGRGSIAHKAPKNVRLNHLVEKSVALELKQNPGLNGY
jgi:hypothetical protein